MTKMMNRLELETVIEKEVNKLFYKVSDHVHDFVNLYVRRNNIQVDHEQMKQILSIVKLAIQDGQLKQIDFFHEGIKKVLDQDFDTSTGVRPFTETPALKEVKLEEKEEKYSFSLT